MPGKLLLITAILLTVIFSKGQGLKPQGVYTSEELNLKECSFDKTADAVVLLDEGYSNFDDRYQLITERHIRIKILKEKGVEWANISIPFYRRNEFEFIDRIEGRTVNVNANGQAETILLDKKSIFTQKTNDVVGEIKFTFPAVKAGSIIEYSYRSIMKSYDGLDDWEFQKEIPVIQSSYKLYIIPGAEFAYRVYKKEDYGISIVPNPSSGNIFFEMKNIPGLREEAYMDAKRDYIQRVTFQLSTYSGRGYKQKYMTTWPEVTRELMSLSAFGNQLDKDLAGTDEFIREVKAMSSPVRKMEMVYNYVKQYMNWNGINSKYSVDGVKSAWNKKTGNSGDMNLILVNLLRSVGLDANPMLVSERHHGQVNADYPFIDQFNIVYAVVDIDNKKYFLDATNIYTPAHIIPYNILNTTAFIVNRKTGGLIEIKDEQFKYRESIFVNASIEDGKLKGKTTINSVDYARVIRIGRYKRDKTKYVESYLTNGLPGVSIENFKVDNEDNDSTSLLQEFDFTFPLTSSGDYQFINLNLFTGESQNPFISDNRFTNINFGYKQFIVLNVLINLPSDYVVDALPKPIRMITPDKSMVFEERVSNENGRLNASIQVQINNSLFTADEYNAVKQFYSKMFESLTEQVVLKKK